MEKHPDFSSVCTRKAQHLASLSQSLLVASSTPFNVEYPMKAEQFFLAEVLNPGGWPRLGIVSVDVAGAAGGPLGNGGIMFPTGEPWGCR